MQMALEPASAFELLRDCYRSGLLDDMVAVAGQALDMLVRDTGLGVGDLLGLLDSVPVEAVAKAEETAAAADPVELVKRLAADLEKKGSRERMAGALALGLERAVEAARDRAPVSAEEV